MGVIASTFVLLLLLRFDPSDTSVINFVDYQLHEGSPCRLADRSEGQCAKAVVCPEKILQIRSRKYNDTDRCGFSSTTADEIVCCSKTSLRPAGSACAKYAKMLQHIRPERPVKGRRRGQRQVAGNNTREARPLEAPFIAALSYPKTTGEPITCAGNLISERHVLTAAHCIINNDNLPPNEVILGTVDRTKTHGASVQRIPISNIIKHPRYKKPPFYHDLAILELKYPVVFTSYVRPICLTTRPITSSDQRNQDLIILGWGLTSFDGDSSDMLRVADSLSFVETQECSRSYRGSKWLHLLPEGLDDGIICARDSNNVTDKSDTCQGDSGGPLYFNKTGFGLLAGITSFGFICGGNTPGVYTSVYKYIDWIEENVWPDKILNY